MTKESTKRLKVTLCSCTIPFQRENFRRHRKANKKEGSRHNKEKVVHYCTECNEWKSDDGDFQHGNCTYVRLSHANMLLVLKGEPPLQRERLVVKAKEAAAKEAAAKEAVNDLQIGVSQSELL